MDTSTSLKELREEDLDIVSAGKTLHFGNPHHIGRLHFGNNVVQTNIAIQIGVAIGGSVIQLINQSNISDPLLSAMM
jgi:hypothetical protein